MMRWSKVKADLAFATAMELVQKLAGYAVLAILARHIDKTGMGQLFFALTLASLTAAATELGTSRYLVREIAISPKASLRRLGEVLALRVPLILAAFLVLNVGVAIFRPDLLAVVSLAAAAGLFGDLYYAFGAFFIGRREVGLRLATGLSGPLVLVALVAAVVARGATLTEVLACYLVASLVPVGASVLLVMRRVGSIPLADTYRGAWAAARASLPFFFLTTLGALHFKVDTLLLFALASPAAVATYEAGYKLFEVSRLLVRPTATVIYPLAAALAARGDWKGFSRVVRRLVAVWGALGVAISIAVIAAADPAVTLVWGDHYADTVPLLRILYLAVPSLYLAFVATFLAGALNIEGAAAKVLGLCLAANVGLNLLTIPRWGPIAAAWSTVATQMLAAAWLLWLVHRRVRSRIAAGSSHATAASSPMGLLADG